MVAKSGEPAKYIKDKPIRKDRFVKPPLTSAIEWFIEFGVPFCRAIPVEIMFEKAFDIFFDFGGKKPGNIKWPLWVQESEEISSKDGVPNWIGSEIPSSAMADLDILRSIASRLVEQATTPDSFGESQPTFCGSRLNLWESRSTFAKSEYEDAARNYLKPFIAWEKETKKFEYRIRERKKNEDFWKYFSGSVKIALLSKLLEALGHDRNETPVGSYYFSFCRACKLVFIKKRNDQKYCNHSCAARQCQRNRRRDRDPLP